MQIEPHDRSIAAGEGGLIGFHATSTQAEGLGVLDQRLDTGTATFERLDDLRGRMLLDLGGSLYAIGIDGQRLDGFDIGGAVIALVGAHLFELAVAKEGAVCMNGWQE
jgi:hypothetical protein